METADPNARLFPLYSLIDDTGLHPGELGFDSSRSLKANPNIFPQWIEAAKKAGVPGADADIAETFFYALLGITASDQWLAEQSVQSDEFPDVPLPDSAVGLADAAEVGRRYAALCDPDVDVPGVTSGAIDAALQSVAIPDVVAGPVRLTMGRVGFSGGRRVGQDVLWDEAAGWRNVPEDLWQRSLAGFDVLSKWLSYRVGMDLSVADREAFMHLSRRLVAIGALASRADVLYQSARLSPLEA
jgi:hypothetical protein